MTSAKQSCAQTVDNIKSTCAIVISFEVPKFMPKHDGFDNNTICLLHFSDSIATNKTMTAT